MFRAGGSFGHMLMRLWQLVLQVQAQRENGGYWTALTPKVHCAQAAKKGESERIQFSR